MDPKPRPNHEVYIRALRRMTPEQRLLKALELGELSRELLHSGLRQRFPELDERDLRQLYVGRLEKCRSPRY